MPSLKPAYEAFCRAYITDPNAARAARAAGYSDEYANRQGYRLLQRAPVKRRLAELQAELVERECGTPTALLAKLEMTYRAAMKRDQPVAAARVIEMQVKLVGLMAKVAPASPSGVQEDLAAMRAALTHMAKQLGLTVPNLAKPA